MVKRSGFLAGLILLAGLSLAACVSNAPPSLSSAEVANLRLERVTVTVAADAMLSWAGGETEFARSKGVTPPVLTASERDSQATSPVLSDYQERYSALSKTPEAKAFVRNRAAELVREGVAQEVAGRLKGRQAVRIEVILRTVHVRDPLLRILVENDDVLTADASVVDSATGRMLASYPGLQVTQRNTGGFIGATLDSAVRGDSVHRMARLYGQRLGEWLAPT